MVDVEKLLAAIEETERNAEAMKNMRWVFTQARMSGHTVMKEYFGRHDPAAVLRRCAQDRLMVEAVQRRMAGHPGEHTNEDDLYDSCSLCIEWNGNALPESVLDYLARGYGISVEEETT